MLERKNLQLSRTSGDNCKRGKRVAGGIIELFFAELACYGKGADGKAAAKTKSCASTATERQSEPAVSVGSNSLAPSPPEEDNQMAQWVDIPSEASSSALGTSAGARVYSYLDAMEDPSPLAMKEKPSPVIPPPSSWLWWLHRI